MLRRTLLVSGLILASTVGFANSAKAAPGPADTENINFSVSLGNTCTLGTPTLGTLKDDGSGKKLTTDTAGTVDVDCNGKAEITVASPVVVTEPTATTKTVLLTLGSDTTDGTTPISIGSAGIKATASVNMMADGGATTLTPGTYEYTVLVTATPK